MKRAERSEYTYIKNYEKQFDLGYGTTAPHGQRFLPVPQFR